MNTIRKTHHDDSARDLAAAIRGGHDPSRTELTKLVDWAESLDALHNHVCSDAVLKLFDLFDVLHAIGRHTFATLWSEDHPEAEYALRLWCSARQIKLDEHKSEAGHSITARAPTALGGTISLVTVRLDRIRSSEPTVAADDNERDEVEAA